MPGAVAAAELDVLGYPVVVTLNEPGWPAKNVTTGGLVIFGPSLTFSIRLCVADPSVPASTVTESWYWPPVRTAGVPLRVAVLPLALKCRPAGKVLPRLRTPSVAETVKVPAVPTVNI